MQLSQDAAPDAWQALFDRGWTKLAIARALELDPSTVHRWFNAARLNKVQLIAFDWLKARNPLDFSPPKRALDAAVAGVYYIKQGDFVKIGRTNRLQRRMSALQIGNPEPLRLLAWLPGHNEKEHHQRWRNERVRGEWFRHVEGMPERNNGM